MTCGLKLGISGHSTFFIVRRAKVLTHHASAIVSPIPSRWMTAFFGIFYTHQHRRDPQRMVFLTFGRRHQEGHEGQQWEAKFGHFDWKSSNQKSLCSDFFSDSSKLSNLSIFFHFPNEHESGGRRRSISVELKRWKLMEQASNAEANWDNIFILKALWFIGFHLGFSKIFTIKIYVWPATLFQD